MEFEIEEIKDIYNCHTQMLCVPDSVRGKLSMVDMKQIIPTLYSFYLEKRTKKNNIIGMSINSQEIFKITSIDYRIKKLLSSD